MELEVVGKHALLFDDDAMAAFVNSPSALVDWNSLSIDRYDVRHLLPGPLPPRLKRRPLHPSPLEPDLDHLRYLDLPPPSSSHQHPQDNNSSDPVSLDSYRAVPFQYANPNEPADTKDNDTESGFRPPFPVPESLLHSLPPNEKVHQIISRTAMFVSKHGSQSEIVLRVKQGDNPTFGFLMPVHHLHAYFKYLVDHQDLLKGVNEDGNPPVDKNRSQGLDQTGGALSLLGSVYGSGEDEDGTTDNTRGFEKNECEVVVDAVSSHDSAEKEQAESSLDIARKVGSISKKPISLEEKVPVIKRNQSISTVKAAIAARAKASDALDSMSNAADKSQTSVPNTAKVELPVVEPPSDLKGVIEKVVEFILKNGKQFEAVLAEQDRPHGRFPFLVPSNRYHTYYLKVLQNPEESKLPGKGFQKHSPAVREGDNNTNVHEESDNLSFGSVGSDLPCDMDRKEKFKMIIGKSKKDGQDPAPKDSQPQNTICMDAAAAAAILQAATRGIRNPSIEIFTKASSGNSQGPGSYVKSPSPNAEDSASVHVDKTTVEKVDIAVAGEADSSEAHMTKEQRLKAERLKRAKMFAAMIKNQAEPFKREVSRGLSVEPPGYGLSSSDAETGNLAGKEREGSSAPLDVDNSDKKSEDKHSADNSDKSHKSEEKLAADNDERRSKRKYRSRSSRHEEEAEEEEEEESREDKRDHKRSKKKHRSHRSSHSSRDRHSHKRRHSSSKEDKYSYKRIKHDSSSDDEPHHSRHHRKSDSSSGEKHHASRRQHRENSMSDNERRHSRHRHKHHSSSDDEHEHRHRSIKHKSRSHAERETDLEEGEINMKSDKSKASKAGHVSREASVELSKSNLNANATSQSPETTDVSDELRAKIRAMLMANL